MKKRIAALLLCVAMLLTFTSCLGNVYTHVVTVDGVEISAGMYLLMQMTAYSEAEGYMDEDDTDVLKIKIEGQSATSWIRQRTEEYLRRYIAVERMVKEYGVKMSSDTQSNLETTLSYWTYFETSYTANGVSYDTWRYQVENSYMDDELFNTLYGDDGALAHPVEESQQAYAESFAHVRYFTLPVTAAESTEEGVETPDVTAEAGAYVEQMLADLQAGKTFDELAAEDLESLYTLTNRTFDVTTASEYIYTSYIDYNSEYYEDAWLEELKAAEIGTMGIYDGGTGNVMLYEKIAPFEDDAQWEAQKTTALNYLYTDEYDAWLADIYNAYDVSYVFGARWYYRPSKID